MQPFLDLRSCGDVVWKDVDFRPVGNKERNSLAKQVVYLLGRQDNFIKWKISQHRYPKSTGAASADTSLITSSRLACSRVGQSAAKAVVVDRTNHSAKCECPVKATICWTTGKINVDRKKDSQPPQYLEHNLDCKSNRISQQEFDADAAMYIAHHSPEKIKHLQRCAATVIRNHPTVPRTILINQMQGESRAFGKSASVSTAAAAVDTADTVHTNGSAASMARPVTPDPVALASSTASANSMPAPLQLLRRFANKAIADSQGNISHTEALSALVAKLSDLGCESAVYREPLNPAIASAVTWWDPEIAPPAGLKFDVVTADASFGIDDPKDGFCKGISSMCCITPSRSIKVLAVSAINHEDTGTFQFEASFVAAHYPHLLDTSVVFIVDGDRARWLAIRIVFPLAAVLLCLYHSANNVMKQLGKRSAVLPDDSASTSEGERKQYFLACSACSKVRTIPSQWVNPGDSAAMSHLINFKCGDLCGIEGCNSPLHLVADIEEIECAEMQVLISNIFQLQINIR